MQSARGEQGKLLRNTEKSVLDTVLGPGGQHMIRKTTMIPTLTELSVRKGTGVMQTGQQAIMILGTERWDSTTVGHFETPKEAPHTVLGASKKAFRRETGLSAQT